MWAIIEVFIFWVLYWNLPFGNRAVYSNTVKQYQSQQITDNIKIHAHAFTNTFTQITERHEKNEDNTTLLFGKEIGDTRLLFCFNDTIMYLIQLERMIQYHNHDSNCFQTFQHINGRRIGRYWKSCCVFKYCKAIQRHTILIHIATQQVNGKYRERKAVIFD